MSDMDNYESCDSCKGSGFSIVYPSNVIDCPVCGGAGCVEKQEEAGET